MSFPIYALENFWFGISPIKKKMFPKNTPQGYFQNFFFSRFFVFNWLLGVYSGFFFFFKRPILN